MFHKNNADDLREKSEHLRKKADQLFEKEKWEQAIKQYKKSIVFLRKIANDSVVQDLGAIIYSIDQIQECYDKLINHQHAKMSRLNEKIELKSGLFKKIIPIDAEIYTHRVRKKRNLTRRKNNYLPIRSDVINEGSKSGILHKRILAVVDRLHSERENQNVTLPVQEKQVITKSSKDMQQYMQSISLFDLANQCEQLEMEVKMLQAQNKELKEENKGLKKQNRENRKESDSSEEDSYEMLPISGWSSINSFFKDTPVDESGQQVSPRPF